MTLIGWDASDFDWDRGPMNLRAARLDGVLFFTHKATEATNVKHAHFGEAMRRAADAGIPFLGAYHVVRSPRNAQAEVDYFVNYVDQQFPQWRTWPDFFIQVDLEKWQYDSVPAAEGEDFADLAEAQTGKTAIIYASKGQYGNELAGTSHELWNANYPLNHQTGKVWDLYGRAGGDTGPGWAPYSGRVPKIWQFTSSAIIGGQSTCDGNAFRGSEDDFRAMIGGTMALTPKDLSDIAQAVASYPVDTGVGEPTSQPLGQRAGWAHMHSFWANGAASAANSKLDIVLDRQNEDKVRDAATATAIAGLQAMNQTLLDMIKSAGGSVDMAAFEVRIQAAKDEIKALLESTHQAEMETLRRQAASEVEGLKAELAARSQ